jgi:hypothetical protein
MPSRGVCCLTEARIAARQSSVIARVAPKWPTPGMITPDAPARSAGADGVKNGAPTAVSALRTDVRLPAP